MRAVATAFAVLLIATTLLPATGARADTVINSSPPQNDYPKALRFRAEIAADQEIKDVTLRFSLRNRNLSGYGKPDSFTPGTKVSVTVEIDTNPNTNWVPVGNEFAYHWEVALADGSVVEGKEESFVFLPPGRDWQKAGNELMTVYYYGERANTANRYLSAAAEVYGKIGQGLLKTQLRHVPVKVVLFVSPSELAESQPSKGTTFEASGIVTCGYRPGSADDIVIVAASCSGGSSVDTLRHEFGHILNASAGESSLVKLPSWLDEGLAVTAQEENDFASAYRAAIRRKELLSFDRLSSPPSDPDQTLLFYGQSQAMVDFLVTNKGADKLAQLMQLTKANTRFDTAFRRIYGFDMKGFEAEFRSANGLPPPTSATPSSGQQSGPTPAPTRGGSQPAAPTAVPTARSQAASRDDTDDGLDPLAIGAVGLGVFAALGAMFLFLLSQVLANRRLTAAKAPPPATPFTRPPGDADGPPGG